MLMKNPFNLILGISYLSLSNADIGVADKFFHERSHLGPSVWAFGSSGVSIYSVDGSEKLKQHDNTDICKVTERGQSCGFKDVVSDGRHHVYASNWQGNSTIDVFSIQTGDFVASIDTCGNPWYMDLHPAREELWVHCWGPDPEEGDIGHIDVFSTTSIHSPLDQVLLHDDLVGHAHGTVLVDSSLGHVGYATDLNTPYLYVVDLNTKKVKEEILMPGAAGLFRMAYSPINKHIFIRAYVCCSCGFENADLEECGRGSDRFVDVVTGPNQGNYTGRCGHTCEGSRSDTIGVYEFDTVTNQVVTTWQPNDALGADPYVSSYGDVVALFGNNGGSTIRLLKPNENGMMSKVWGDIEVGFNAEGPSTTEKGVSDSVFIQDSKHNVAVFTSTLANYVVLVDMSKDTPTMKKIILSDSEEITSKHGRGARRNVVWAVGTDYVWLDGEVTEEFYIIKLSPDGDIEKAVLDSVVQGIPTRRLVYVQNYYAEQGQKMIKHQVQKQVAEKTGYNAVGVSGLCLGVLALVLSIFNTVSSSRKSKGWHGQENGNEEMSLPSQV